MVRFRPDASRITPDDPDAIIRDLLEKYGALIRRIIARVGGRVFTSRRDETSAMLPEDIELTAGTYYWRVVALNGDAEAAASPLIPFRFISRER